MSTETKLFIHEVKPGVWLLDEGHAATGYLVLGKEKVCVIDTMNGVCDLGKAVKKITDLPVVVVNTHGHPDHIFGNVYFEEAYLHPADRALAGMFTQSPEFLEQCEKAGVSMPPFRDIREGDVLDLGGRTLEVFSLPGHTPGGILLLLREDCILFTGDSVNHHLWMQLDGCLSLEDYQKNLDGVLFLEKRADVILHGHARDWDDVSLLRCLRDGIGDILEGRTGQDRPYRWFGGEALQHPFALLPGRHYSSVASVVCYRRDNIQRT